jgi:hypothetical protein
MITWERFQAALRSRSRRFVRMRVEPDDETVVVLYPIDDAQTERDAGDRHPQPE